MTERSAGAPSSACAYPDAPSSPSPSPAARSIAARTAGSVPSARKSPTNAIAVAPATSTRTPRWRAADDRLPMRATSASAFGRSATAASTIESVGETAA